MLLGGFIMEQSYFIKAYKKRMTRRFMVLGLCLLVIIGLLCYWKIIYNKDTSNPTIVKTYEDYNNAIKSNSHVKISADKIYDLNIEQMRTKTYFGIKSGHGETTGHVVAIKLGDNILPVSLPNDIYDSEMNQKTGPYKLEGKFARIKDKDSSVLKDSLVKGGVASNQVDLVLCTNYLEYVTPDDSIMTDYLFAGLGVIVLLVIFIPVFLRNAMALRRLKKYSNGNLEMAYEHIDNEIKSSEVYKNGPVTITKSYIIVETQQIVFAMPLSELMWVYKRTVQTTAYGIIPMGKRSGMQFIFSDKSKNQVDLNIGSQRIDEIIQHIYKYCETVYVGYSKELANLFKTNSNEFKSQWTTYKNNIVAKNMKN